MIKVTDLLVKSAEKTTAAERKHTAVVFEPLLQHLPSVSCTAITHPLQYTVDNRIHQNKSRQMSALVHSDDEVQCK